MTVNITKQLKWNRLEIPTCLLRQLSRWQKNKKKRQEKEGEGLRSGGDSSSSGLRVGDFLSSYDKYHSNKKKF